MQVIKRDGRISEYNDERIIKAITLAMSHTTGGVDIDLATKIADSVRNQLKDKVQVSVYEIQDIVEKKLMGSSRKEVAQEYITYRYNRDVARKAKSKDMFLEIIETKSNDVTRENANMNADTPAGMMMKFASETTKPFVDDFLLSTEARTAIKNGYIHIHDKDYYPTKSLTCLQHPLDKILEHGFRAGHGSSRPAKRIETASIIGCISLETVQNEMHGGQAIPAFDYYLAPYVKKTFVEEVKKIEKVKFYISLKHHREEWKGKDELYSALYKLYYRHPSACEIKQTVFTPYDECEHFMDGCDVMLDQLYSYSPGLNALYAMSKGIVVVGGAEEEHYNLLGEDRLRPIINVRPEGNDIYNKLESLLANTNKISQLSADSIEYIKKHHCPIKVAKECLDFWEKN